MALVLLDWSFVQEGHKQLIDNCLIGAVHAHICERIRVYAVCVNCEPTQNQLNSRHMLPHFLSCLFKRVVYALIKEVHVALILHAVRVVLSSERNWIASLSEEYTHFFFFKSKLKFD